MNIMLLPQPNKSVLELLQERGFIIDASCGGSGRCGGCAVRLTEGFLPITDRDREILTEEELADGMRLACMAHPDGAIVVDVTENILSELPGDLSVMKKDNFENTSDNHKNIHITIDLGTTTIAICFYDANGRLLDVQSFLNPQSTYGSDVISRIKAANEGNSEVLSSRIRAAIANCINNYHISNISHIFLAGNTAMIHLLMNWDCAGLAMYPFQPVSLDFIETDAGEIFTLSSHDNGNNDLFKNVPLTVFPGISAFIGGDILAGVYGIGFESLDFSAESSDSFLLLDLGTNGEMVYAGQGQLTAASTSAGPAFEGGNISCGMGFVSGAVDHVVYPAASVTPECHVIGNASPEGLCGSGLLELTDCLLEKGIISPEGEFTDGSDRFTFACNEDGAPLCITQADIRELQLAKAAVRAGIEIISQKKLSTFLTAGDGGVRSKMWITHVYLAGGMGTGLIPERIRHIGLLPGECSIETVGNSCLKGLEKYMHQVINGDTEKARATINGLKSQIRCVDLACESDFNESFINSINFS